MVFNIKFLVLSLLKKLCT